jgi:hypothetical protein
MTTTSANATDALREQMLGDVIAPSDPAYADARRIWNDHIDRQPALLARCSGVATSSPRCATLASTNSRSRCAVGDTQSPVTR